MVAVGRRLVSPSNFIDFGGGRHRPSIIAWLLQRHRPSEDQGQLVGLVLNQHFTRKPATPFAFHPLQHPLLAQTDLEKAVTTINQYY